MMGPLYLFLSLATLSQAHIIAPSAADSNQVPVSGARFVSANTCDVKFEDVILVSF